MSFLYASVSQPTGRDPQTGRGRFEPGRGLRLGFEYLNSFKVAKHFEKYNNTYN